MSRQSSLQILTPRPRGEMSGEGEKSSVIPACAGVNGSSPAGNPGEGLGMPEKSISSFVIAFPPLAEVLRNNGGG